MTESNEDGRLERVRNILRAMDRSIDAARSRRLHEDGDEEEDLVRIGRVGVEPDPGETPPEPRDDRPKEPPRVPTSMFDRDGPRLKARPKRATT